MRPRVPAPDNERPTERTYRLLFEANPSPMWVYDLETLAFLAVNDASVRRYGYSREEFLGMTIEDIRPAEELPRLAENLARAPAGPEESGIWRHRRKDGTFLDVEIASGPIEFAGRRARLVLVNDVDERRRSEKALRESEEKYRRLVEVSPIATWINEGGTITYVNPAGLRLLGASRADQVLGRSALDFIHPDFHEVVRQRVSRMIGDGTDAPPLEERLLRLDGTPVDVEVTAAPFDTPGGRVGQVLIRDITERKRTEEALRQRTLELDAFFNNALDLLCVADTDGRFRRLNKEWESALGYSPEELQRRSFLDYVHPDDVEATLGALSELGAQKEVLNFVNRYRHKDGTYRWIEWRSFPAGRLIYAAARDVTERMRVEKALERANRQLRMLSDCNQALIRGADEVELLASVCSIAVQVGGYRMAWVGYAEDDEHKTVRPMAHAGTEMGYLGLARVTWADDDRGRGPVGAAIRTGRACPVQNILDDPRFEPWREAAAARGYAAVCGLPLVSGERTFGALGIYSSAPDAFDADEVALLSELASDLAFGIAGLRTQEERNRAQQTLRHRQEMEHLIAAISSHFINLDPAETDDAITDALRRIGEFTGADRSYLFFFRDDGSLADNTHEWCREGVEPQRSRRQGLRVEDFPHVVGPVRRSEAVHVPCVADLPAYAWKEKDEFEREGIRSLMVVPIELQKVVVGFLGLDAVREERSWTPEVTSLLRLVGEVFASARERDRAEAALRSSEERYRVVSDISGQLLYERNLTAGQIEYAGRVEEITGYEAKGFNQRGVEGWQALIHPDDRPAVLRSLDAAMRGHRPFLAEYRFRRKDQSYIHVEEHGVFVYDETGRAVRMVGAMRDETDRRNAREERGRLEAQLQQAMKMEAVGRLAGGIAHDFNNLLMVIMANVDLARHQLAAADPFRRYVEEIGTAADRAKALIRQLLTFSRRQIIEPKVVNLNELVGNLQRMLTRLIGEDVTLRTVLDEALGSVLVDPGQFEQVLANLVVNARDAMPHGGRLGIETANVDLDERDCLRHPHLWPGPFVRLAVNDTGVGMSQEVKQHVFEPFFTTKPTGRGTGLGLATIFGVVKQARGAIDFESEVGRGTTFRIYLPRIAESATRLTSGTVESSPPTGDETVLLVEDEDGVRELVSRALQRLGYEVLSAPNGGEALLTAERREGRIDLLLTDVVMPGINGRELAERLSKLHPEMKVLFTSGYTDDEMVRHGVIDGNLRFIGKPYSTNTLATKLREVLDG